MLHISVSWMWIIETEAVSLCMIQTLLLVMWADLGLLLYLDSVVQHRDTHSPPLHPHNKEVCHGNVYSSQVYLIMAEQNRYGKLPGICPQAILSSLGLEGKCFAKSSLEISKRKIRHWAFNYTECNWACFISSHVERQKESIQNNLFLFLQKLDILLSARWLTKFKFRVFNIMLGKIKLPCTTTNSIQRVFISLHLVLSVMSTWELWCLYFIVWGWTVSCCCYGCNSIHCITSVFYS